MTLNFIVNGKPVTLETEPDRRLLDILREDLHLTGTKEGCAEGECGACTVLLDGEAVHSCLTAAIQLEGRAVTTIEGLAEMGSLDIIQTCFVEELAIQCGYCTPGMIMSAEALLRRNPDPTEDEIRLALSGNICRCSGYVQIVRAVKRAAKERRSAVQSLTPKTLAELAQALSAATEKAKIIAGGTDFIIKERAGKFAPDLLIYPGFIPELNTVTKENGVLRIGAAVPMNGITAALKDDKAFCAIADAASDVGSPQIRAKGTMAGNLCNASPAGDMLPVSWLYDAQLELMNADGTASVTPVNGFITGPQKTILRPDQAVTAILIGLKQFEGFVSAFHKIGSRERVSISREGLAAAVRLDESGKVKQARLSLGAVGGTPIRVTDAEEYMRGRVLDEKLVEEITPMVAETIHNNCRPANRLYKTEAARGLTADTFAKLMSRL